MTTPDAPAADTTVHASPTKRFFVEMLTRDIELEDALLDLVDNCIDGVLRVTRGRESTETGFEGYGAEITFSAEEFRISDNCGGIDREIAERYAFMMGRKAGDNRDADLRTVGMYGIGMKRAIFKLGRSAVVRSRCPHGAFEVAIPRTWFASDDNWTLTAHDIDATDAPFGTEVVVTLLQDAVADAFRAGSDFEAAFLGKLRSHYAFLMHKGFSVTVNGAKVEPRPMRFLMDTARAASGGAIAPYMFDAVINGVDVKVTVGLWRPLSADDDGEPEPGVDLKRSSDEAGLTVICNDRVVVYCDKSRTTGWGEANVPGFHAQFNSITGVVVFSSTDPLKLPLTTTKRGIEGGSDIYLQVKDRMREGIKLFTNYTNKWKHALEEARRFERDSESVDIGALRSQVPDDSWRPTRDKESSGRVFMPKLPEPKAQTEEDVNVRFRRPAKAVRRLGTLLLDDATAKPGAVGEAAFDYALRTVKP